MEQTDKKDVRKFHIRQKALQDDYTQVLMKFIYQVSYGDLPLQQMVS